MNEPEVLAEGGSTSAGLEDPAPTCVGCARFFKGSNLFILRDARAVFLRTALGFGVVAGFVDD